MFEKQSKVDKTSTIRISNRYLILKLSVGNYEVRSKSKCRSRVKSDWSIGSRMRSTVNWFVISILPSVLAVSLCKTSAKLIAVTMNLSSYEIRSMIGFQTQEDIMPLKLCKTAVSKGKAGQWCRQFNVVQMFAMTRDMAVVVSGFRFYETWNNHYITSLLWNTF